MLKETTHNGSRNEEQVSESVLKKPISRNHPISTKNVLGAANLFNSPADDKPKTSTNLIKQIGANILSQIKAQIDDAEDIYTDLPTHTYTPAWRRRQINNLGIRKQQEPIKQQQEVIESDSSEESLPDTKVETAP